MTSKFDFYEIVRVVSDNAKHVDINGKLGIVRGKVQNETTSEWVYGITIYGSDGMIRRVYEKQLQITGQKADPKNFKPVETVRVRFNHKNGEADFSED